MAPPPGEVALPVETARARTCAYDRRENAWHKKVCNGTLTLKRARAQELAYKRAHG
jgi:hypothetical protein